MGKKGQKGAVSKPKHSATLQEFPQQIQEKPNEEKPAPEVTESVVAMGDLKLQRQHEKELREEKERAAVLEQRKQEAKNNSKKKNNAKPKSRTQKNNESKLIDENPESKIIHDKSKMERSTSGEWNVQNTVIEKNRQDCQNDVPHPETSFYNDNNSYDQTESKQSLVIKRDYNESYNNSGDNSHTGRRQAWKRKNSYQNNDVNERSDSQNYMYNSSQEQKKSATGNWRNSKDADQNYSRDYKGLPGNEKRDAYSKFENKHSNFYNRNEFHQNSRYSKYDGNHDSEYMDFVNCTKQKNSINHKKLSEIRGDLFSASKDYSLAHCVAEDMSMGAGIAKTFRSKFGKVGNLLNQKQKTGGLAVLNDEERYIYYLVTKEQSRGKPTLYTLWLSLQKLKQHIVENQVTKLAIPTIGCGLDRLDWDTVKQMLEHVFRDVDINIVVYVWDENVAEETTTKLMKKCAVVHAQMKLTDIQKETGLLYFGTVDGLETEEFKLLANKYNITASYKKSKSISEVIKTIDKNEYIYGLIIKESVDAEANFEEIETAIKSLRNMLKKDKTEYVGLQAFIDKNDRFLLEKIIALMQYIFLNVEIWVCWPDELAKYCPQQQKTYY